MDAVAPNPSALLGRTLAGNYLLTELLGEGAMGAVYRAVPRLGDTDVAVKVLWPYLAHDASIQARFHQEASIARKISHANTVQVFEHGSEGELSFLVMELVEGRTLYEALAEAGKLPIRRAVRILLQVCSALSAAHERGIVHRDLKPENVMLLGKPGEPQGERVKLVDFGIAKRMPGAVEEDEDTQMLATRCGTIIGTPGYMAPEQCRGAAVDRRADIYACGAMLFELITGEQPIVDRDPVQVVWRLTNEPPRRPSSLVAAVPADLDDAIVRALARKPEDRQQSALELRNELLRALMNLVKAEDLLAGAAPAAPVVALPPVNPLAATLPAPIAFADAIRAAAPLAPPPAPPPAPRAAAALPFDPAARPPFRAAAPPAFTAAPPAFTAAMSPASRALPPARAAAAPPALAVTAAPSAGTAMGQKVGAGLDAARARRTRSARISAVAACAVLGACAGALALSLSGLIQP